MTLLTMCNRVLSENGFREYATIVGNTDPGAKQILALANAAIRALVRDYDWPQLETEWSFPTVPPSTAHTLPTGFKKPILDTLYDTDQYFNIKSAVTAQQWQRYRIGMLGSTLCQKFRLSWSGTPSLLLSTVPDYVQNLTLLFLSKLGVTTAGPTYSELFVADADTSRVPEEIVELSLRWRFRRAKGLDFSAEQKECDNTCAAELAAYMAVDEIPVGGLIIPYEAITCGTIPENGFGE